MLTSSDGESSPKLEEILSAQLAVRPKVSRLKERLCWPLQMGSLVSLQSVFCFKLQHRHFYGHLTVSWFLLLYDFFFICEGCEPEDSSDSLLPACRAYQGGIWSCVTGQYFLPHTIVQECESLAYGVPDRYILTRVRIRRSVWIMGLDPALFFSGFER